MSEPSRRAALTFRVRYDDPATGVPQDAVARDLSRSGAFVTTLAPASEGTEIALALDLDGVPVSLNAYVESLRADGMQVRFVGVPDQVAGLLDAATTMAGAQGRTILGVGSSPSVESIKAATTTAGAIAPPPTRPKANTIHGVGGANIRETDPGIALPSEPPPPIEPEPDDEPRAPVPIVAPEPEAVASSPVGPSSSGRDVSRSETTARVHRRTSTPPPPPPRRRRGLGLLVFVLFAGAVAFAAYAFRGPLSAEIARRFGPAPLPTATDTAPTAVPTGDGGPITDGASTSSDDASATVAVATAADASSDASDDGILDASADASGDGGKRDAGASDAGAKPRDAGAKDAGHRHGAGGGGGHGGGRGRVDAGH